VIAAANPAKLIAENSEVAPWRAFLEELRKRGYVEGNNLVIERYSGEGNPAGRSALARAVASGHPDLVNAVTLCWRRRSKRKLGRSPLSPRCWIQPRTVQSVGTRLPAQRPPSEKRVPHSRYLIRCGRHRFHCRRGLGFLIPPNLRAPLSELRKRLGKAMSDRDRANALAPAQISLYQERIAPLTWAALRIVVGGFLIPHGAQKLFQTGVAGLVPTISKIGFEPALAWAYAVGWVEFLGGILVAVGLLTRVAAFAVAVELLVIVVAIKSANGFFTRNNGLEFELLWAILFLLIVVKGPGRYSIDRLFWRGR